MTGVIAQIVFAGQTSPAGQSMKQLPFTAPCKR